MNVASHWGNEWVCNVSIRPIDVLKEALTLEFDPMQGPQRLKCLITSAIEYL